MKLLRLVPRFRKAYQAFDLLHSREYWTRGQIEAFQLERVNAVWGHAIDHVPYYRDLFKQHRLPIQFDSLDTYKESVPVLPKALVRENRLAFFSSNPQPGWWSRTGGSTGTPMAVYWAKNAHLEMLRAQYRFRQIWDVDPLDKMAYLWGNSKTTKPGVMGMLHKFHQPLMDRLRSRIRLSAYDLGIENLHAYFKQIDRTRPRSIYGYPSALNLLAMEAGKVDFKGDSLKALFLTGEPTFPDVAQNLERVFNIPAVIEYGSYECGFTAFECRDRTLRIREDVSMVETLPAVDGKQKLIISVLTNPSFPLLRYSIEDITDMPVEYPEQGFAILKNVVGRNNDMIVSKSGRHIHSSRFDAFFKYQSRAIRRFRMRQRMDGSIRVWVELYDNATLPNVESLQEILIDLVEGHPVKLKVVKDIPRLSSGKHRSVISDLVKPYGSKIKPAEIQFQQKEELIEM